MLRRGFRLVSLPPGGLALALLGLIVGASRFPAAAQEIAVPVEVHVPILLKILTFDRALASAADPLVVAIVFQGRNRASVAVSEDVRDQLAAAAGRIRVVPIDLDDARDLRTALLHDNVRVLYVAPLQAVSVASVAAATRAQHVLSVTGVPRYVSQGLTVGIDLSGTRPEIVINLAASRAEGADLSAQLLKLSRLVGPKEAAP